MRALLVIVLMVASVAAGDEVPTATIRGRVVALDAPLPGCMVTLTAQNARTTVSDANGDYSFTAVRPGMYEIAFELAGFKLVTRDVHVTGGLNALDDEKLRLDPRIEAITLQCNLAPCTDGRSESAFDLPECTERELNTTLIDAMERGDRSATALLQQRQKTAFTYLERHRLAGALLGRVPDDREYWNELREHTTNLIRFAYVAAEPSPEFIQWCTERDVDPDDYRGMAFNAMREAALDSRARPLFLRALITEDRVLIEEAITGFALQHDESALPAIEKSIRRFADDVESLAMLLVYFQSEAADRLAYSLLDESDRETYVETRRELSSTEN